MASIVANFNYPTTYRVGAGRLDELPSACLELGVTRPLLVTDAFLNQRPWFEHLRGELARAGVEDRVFSDVGGNPDQQTVERGVAAFLDGRHDGVVAIGGGSPIDVGKAIALMVDQSGSLFEYEDIGDNWRKIDGSAIAPILAVPTTAGTGSEVGRASVILDRATGHKRIVFHPRMMPSWVVADPNVTLGLPPDLTAATGMDAFAHAFEAFCAPTYHPMADGIALEAMRLVSIHLPRAFADGNDVEARTHMLVAASMGATAFQKGLGLVHALSHPLGGVTGIHHGTANAIFLPYVMEYNRTAIAPKLARMAAALELPSGDAYDVVMQWLLELRRTLEMPHTLAEAIAFDETLARKLAPMAIEDPSMGGNPSAAGVADCEALFLRAWRGQLGDA